MGSRKSCVSTVRSGSNQSSSGVRSIPNASDNLVGVAGFEPTASSSRTTANRENGCRGLLMETCVN
jgi:hypothetical protein